MSPVKMLNKLDRKKSLGELVYNNQYPSFFEKTASSTADASEESTESQLSEAVDNQSQECSTNSTGQNTNP